MFNRLINVIAKRVDASRKLASLREGEVPGVPYPSEVRASTQMERMFGDCAPAIVAFKIDNGYVVRSMNTGPQHEIGSYASGFTYCKDHAAIADYIVSEAAREKVMPNYSHGLSNAKIGQVNTAPLPYRKTP